MRKIALLGLMLLVAVTLTQAAGSAASSSTAPAAAAPADSGPTSCGPIDISKMSEVDRNAWLAERGLEFRPQPERAEAPPPCPALDGCGGHPSCTGSTSCAKTAQTGVTDTGLTSCRAAGGGLTCTNGGTILSIEYSCHSCPCCSGPNPTCLCGECSVGHDYKCGDPS